MRVLCTGLRCMARPWSRPYNSHDNSFMYLPSLAPPLWPVCGHAARDRTGTGTGPGPGPGTSRVLQYMYRCSCKYSWLGSWDELLSTSYYVVLQ